MREDRKKPNKKPRYSPNKRKAPLKEPGLERLNKVIANSGVCSRREADKLIEAGLIKVNGKVVIEMGYKVKPDDQVKYQSKILTGERKVFIIMNKPKDHITTVTDTHDRKTVMHIVQRMCKERVYPVGRLDRNTTGLLLFTNDGEMAKRLMHPSYGIKKIYHAQLDKVINAKDLQAIRKGVILEDGKAQIDVVEYIGDKKDRRKVGLELHSGKNRIIRRVFEHLGFKVMQLDRIGYAGLTKKDIPRGRCRYMTQKEVGMLKMGHGK
ncbi:MAG: rRNA pseudouridine synthase [Flavobacteriales bacterium]|nr:rRNA pseudouridine synthase [Flavobacteriales bacterium]